MALINKITEKGFHSVRDDSTTTSTVVVSNVGSIDMGGAGFSKAPIFTQVLANTPSDTKVSVTAGLVVVSGSRITASLPVVTTANAGMEIKFVALSTATFQVSGATGQEINDGALTRTITPSVNQVFTFIAVNAPAPQGLGWVAMSGSTVL